VKTTLLERKNIVTAHVKKKIKESDKHNELMIQEAKKVLIESGLSVTALNHFLECPSKFLYESILKLPQAPAVSAEKGNAMHAALSNVWALEKKTIEHISQTIEKTVSEYVDKSFLSQFEKESLKSELVSNVPIVAKALE